jgi:hypothetical protein
MTTRVSNPLTVIAIFAGLAEAFATVALIYVPHDIQQIFVYFVMAFPALLVVLFFCILNWNHTVLYAPSDFEDEAMYLESIRLKAIKSEIIGTLTTADKDSVPLTAQQVEIVSKKVDKIIEAAGASPRRQQVLELLSEGPSTLSAISDSLNLNRSYAMRVLSALVAEGQVVKIASGRSIRWSLPSSGTGA